MPNSALASLTAASSLSGAELLYVLQGGNDRKLTATQISSFVVGGLTISSSQLSGTIPSSQITGTAATLTGVDQILSGGAIVTASSQGTKSSGTYTVDPGVCPLQYITNGGAFTLAAPANDGSMILLIYNSSSAGVVTFSGFSVGTNTGDALTTTSSNKFSINIWRINGTSGYNVVAHQ